MMRIDLGKHVTYEGREILAWIEPNFPFYRAGAVRDHGYLCIEEIGIMRSGSQVIKLRLEGMAEEAEMLNAVLGPELGMWLWDERQKYDERPYYRCAIHAVFGRIYFEPYLIDTGAIGVAITSRSAKTIDGCLPIPIGSTLQHLRTLCEQHYLHPLQKLPDSHGLTEAIQHSWEQAHSILRSHEDFKACVDWDFERRLTTIMIGATGREPLRTGGDIARFDTLSLFAIRPAVDSLLAGTVEFKRWFYASGKPRLEPLTSEELASELQAGGMPRSTAKSHASQCALPAADWEWLKEKRLGRMRIAVDLLHDLITHQSRCGEGHEAWVASATKAADFCSPMPASPSRIFTVIRECPLRLTLPVQLRRRLTEVLAYMSNPANGLSIQCGQPVAKLLDAVHQQNASSIARWKARCANDSPACAFESLPQHPLSSKLVQ